MADLGAIERAAGSGALPPEAAPVEETATGADGMEMLAEGMQAISAFIDTQGQQGNPGAEQAMVAFQQLVEAMKGMAGGEAPAAPAGPEQVPLEGGQTVI